MFLTGSRAIFTQVEAGVRLELEEEKVIYFKCCVCNSSSLPTHFCPLFIVLNVNMPPSPSYFPSKYTSASYLFDNPPNKPLIVC